MCRKTGGQRLLEKMFFKYSETCQSSFHVEAVDHNFGSVSVSFLELTPCLLQVEPKFEIYPQKNKPL